MNAAYITAYGDDAAGALLTLGVSFVAIALLTAAGWAWRRVRQWVHVRELRRDMEEL